jgi:hypothetical protein
MKTAAHVYRLPQQAQSGDIRPIGLRYWDHLPPEEGNGVSYLKIPVNVL